MPERTEGASKSAPAGTKSGAGGGESRAVFNNDEATQVARLVVSAARSLPDAHFPERDGCVLHAHIAKLESETRSRELATIAYWQDDLENGMMLRQEALRIVTAHITCARCGDNDVEGATRMGKRTFIAHSSKALLHVWSSRKEARRFHEALRRAAQAKFEHMVPSPVHVPLAGLVAHQGALVSVVWLPPLISGSPQHVPKGGDAWAALELLREGLALRPGVRLPLFLGADARLYLIGVNEIMQAGALALPSGKKVSARHELLISFPSRAPLNFGTAVSDIIPKTLIPQVAARLYEGMRPRGGNMSPNVAVSEGSVGEELHGLGLNVCLLPMLLEFFEHGPPVGIDTSVPVGAAALDDQGCVRAVDAIRGEIVARTLKNVVADAMDEVTIPDYATAEVYEMERAEAAEGVLKEFFKSADFFNRLMTLARRKFVSLRNDDRLLGFDRKVVKSCLAGIVRFSAYRLGLDLSENNKEVDGLVSSPVLFSARSMPASIRPLLLRITEDATAVRQSARLQLPPLSAFALADGTMIPAVPTNAAFMAPHLVIPTAQPVVASLAGALAFGLRDLILSFVVGNRSEIEPRLAASCRGLQFLSTGSGHMPVNLTSLRIVGLAQRALINLAAAHSPNDVLCSLTADVQETDRMLTGATSFGSASPSTSNWGSPADPFAASPTASAMASPSPFLSVTGPAKSATPTTRSPASQSLAPPAIGGMRSPSPGVSPRASPMTASLSAHSPGSAELPLAKPNAVDTLHRVWAALALMHALTDSGSHLGGDAGVAAMTAAGMHQLAVQAFPTMARLRPAGFVGFVTAVAELAGCCAALEHAHAQAVVASAIVGALVSASLGSETGWRSAVADSLSALAASVAESPHAGAAVSSGDEVDVASDEDAPRWAALCNVFEVARVSLGLPVANCADSNIGAGFINFYTSQAAGAARFWRRRVLSTLDNLGPGAPLRGNDALDVANAMATSAVQRGSKFRAWLKTLRLNDSSASTANAKHIDEETQSSIDFVATCVHCAALGAGSFDCAMAFDNFMRFAASRGVPLLRSDAEAGSTPTGQLRAFVARMRVVIDNWRNLRRRRAKRIEALESLRRLGVMAVEQHHARQLVSDEFEGITRNTIAVQEWVCRESAARLMLTMLSLIGFREVALDVEQSKRDLIAAAGEAAFLDIEVAATASVADAQGGEEQRRSFEGLQDLEARRRSTSVSTEDAAFSCISFEWEWSAGRSTAVAACVAELTEELTQAFAERCRGEMRAALLSMASDTEAFAQGAGDALAQEEDGARWLIEDEARKERASLPVSATTNAAAKQEPAPTTTAAKQEPAPTTTAAKQEPAPTTTAAKQEPAPTTTAAKQEPAPASTTTAAKQEPAPTTTAAKQEPAPTTTAAKQEPAPTTTAAKQEPAPTTTAAKQEPAPASTTTAAKQEPAVATSTSAAATVDSPNAPPPARTAVVRGTVQEPAPTEDTEVPTGRGAAKEEPAAQQAPGHPAPKPVVRRAAARDTASMTPEQRRVATWADATEAPGDGIDVPAVRERLAAAEKDVADEEERTVLRDAARRYNDALIAAKREFDVQADAVLRRSQSRSPGQAPRPSEVPQAPPASATTRNDDALPELRKTSPVPSDGAATPESLGQSGAEPRSKPATRKAPSRLTLQQSSVGADSSMSASPEMSLAEEIRSLWVSSNKRSINAGNARRRQLDPLSPAARAKAATAVPPPADKFPSVPDPSRSASVNGRRLPKLGQRTAGGPAPSKAPRVVPNRPAGVESMKMRSAAKGPRMR